MRAGKLLAVRFIIALLILATTGIEGVLANGSVLPAESGQVIDNIITAMTPEEKVGQLLMPAFRQWQGRDVTEINARIARIIDKYHLGGVVLFKENVVNTVQTVKLVDQLQAVSGNIPLFIAIDQEGGRVARLQTGTAFPGNMALGATHSLQETYQVGRDIGEELQVLGININLAPVLDVNVNPSNPVIGVRSFGADAQMVGEHGAAYIRGLHDAGIIAAVKHFPGHGDTIIDSHLGLPVVPHSQARLKTMELIPFQMAIKAGADMVMTTHVAFPAFDSSKLISRRDGTPVILPATMSYTVLTELLRGEMGFNGVIITDALNMGAIVANFDPEDAVIRCVQAGADIVLMPADLDKAYAALVEAVKNGRISQERIDISVKRLLTLKLKYGIARIEAGRLALGTKDSVANRVQQANVTVGSAEHKATEQAVAEKAVTLVKNEGAVLPFKLDGDKKIVLLAPGKEMLYSMAQPLRLLTANTKMADEVIELNYEGKHNLNDVNSKLMTSLAKADYIILGSYSRDLAGRTPGHWSADFPASVVEYADKVKKPLAVIALGNPYDLAYMPEAKAYIAVYGTNNSNITAGIEAVFGRINPAGKLPVAIPGINGADNLYEIGHGLSYDYY